MTDYDRPGRVLKIMAVLEQFGKHELNMKEAAEKIDDFYHPKQTEADRPTRNFDSYHWVICDNKGKVDVYHVGTCAGGDDCDLVVYLNTIDKMEKHLKRGGEYEVIKNKDGQFEFSRTNETGSEIIKSTPRESTQVSLLEKS